MVVVAEDESSWPTVVSPPRRRRVGRGRRRSPPPSTPESRTSASWAPWSVPERLPRAAHCVASATRPTRTGAAPATTAAVAIGRGAAGGRTRGPGAVTREPDLSREARSAITAAPRADAEAGSGATTSGTSAAVESNSVTSGTAAPPPRRTTASAGVPASASVRVHVPRCSPRGSGARGWRPRIRNA